MRLSDLAVERFLDALADYLHRHPTLPQAKPIDVRRDHAIGRLMPKCLPRGHRQVMKQVLAGLQARYAAA